MRVDLPAPFSPRRPWILPASRVRLTPSLARVSPKDLWISRSSTATFPVPSSDRTGEGGLPRLPPRAGPHPGPSGLDLGARSAHALEQLGLVPDLLVGGRLA